MAHNFSPSQQAAYDVAQKGKDMTCDLTEEDKDELVTLALDIAKQVKQGLTWNAARAISNYLHLVQTECGDNEEVNEVLEDFYQARADGKATGEDKRVVRWAIKHLPKLKEVLLKNDYTFLGLTVVNSLIIYKHLYTPKYKDVVYFIRNPNGLIKIGFTSNLPERLKTLINSSGNELEVLYTFTPVNADISYIEARLHGRYGADRVMGEWFRIEYNHKEWKAVCEDYDNGK